VLRLGDTDSGDLLGTVSFLAFLASVLSASILLTRWWSRAVTAAPVRAYLVDRAVAGCATRGFACRLLERGHDSRRAKARAAAGLGDRLLRRGLEDVEARLVAGD
jgi:hypothetical protein